MYSARLGDSIYRRLPELEFDVGNAGTVMRPLTAILSLLSGKFILTGNKRMQERPIQDLVDALRQLGADISYLKNRLSTAIYSWWSLYKGKKLTFQAINQVNTSPHC